jgi:hypothetical protein
MTHTARLKPEVRHVALPDGRLVLYGAGGNPVRVSPAVQGIWRELVTGEEFEKVAARLEELHPRARDSRTRLAEFLDTLEAAGLLEDNKAENSRPKRQPLMLWNPDPFAARVAGVVLRLPAVIRNLTAILCVAAAVLGGVLLLKSTFKPRFIDAFIYFSPFGIAVIAVVAVPLHELGHAIACRLAGVRSGRLGLRWGRLFLPQPFVETPESFLATGSWRRFGIAAGGLVCDLIVGGAAAWIALLTARRGVTGAAATQVFLYCLMAVTVGTSPIQPGDGSNMLAALLNRDLAGDGSPRGAISRVSPATRVQIYRAVGIGHIVLTGLLLWKLR